MTNITKLKPPESELSHKRHRLSQQLSIMGSVVFSFVSTSVHKPEETVSEAEFNRNRKLHVRKERTKMTEVISQDPERNTTVPEPNTVRTQKASQLYYIKLLIIYVKRRQRRKMRKRKMRKKRPQLPKR